MSHITAEQWVTLFNGIMALVTAYFTHRNRKDIDGVAIKAGTERALARLEKRENAKVSQPATNPPENQEKK